MQAQTPIKIGFMAELSGPQGALGVDQYDALMLVVERNGGKLGGVPVQIIKEDSQLKTDLAQQIVDKLIEKDKVQIITGVSFSNVMMAMHRKITEKEVFLIGSNAGPSPIAGAQCSPYFFSSSWQNDTQAEVVGKYAADKGYKRLYLMAPNYQAGKDFVAGFKRYYKGEVVNEAYTSLAADGFLGRAGRAGCSQAGCGVRVLSGRPGHPVPQAVQAGRAAREDPAAVDLDHRRTDPARHRRRRRSGVIAGIVLGSGFQAIPASQQFVAEFEKKYGRIPSQYAAQSYDAAQLLDSAIAKVKGNVSDKKAFLAALKAADFKSVRGSFRFNNNNFPIQDMYVFEVATDPKGRYSLKTIATPLKNHEDAYHTQCPLK